MNIIVKRNIKEYDSWKQFVSTGNEMRRQSGSKGVIVYRNAADPNEVYMVFEWEDDKPWRDYFNRPDAQKALAEWGTTEFIEVSESFHLEA